MFAGPFNTRTSIGNKGATPPSFVSCSASDVGQDLSIILNNISTYLTEDPLQRVFSARYRTNTSRTTKPLLPTLGPMFREAQPLSFFDYLVSDIPAVATQYDGEFSVSTRRGAYHIIAGESVDPNWPDEVYAFFCMKKADPSSFAVRIVPPLKPIKAVQMSSMYANFWIFDNQGNTQSQPVPDVYCKYGLLIEASQPGAQNRVNTFSFQIFPEWVVFSGETREEGRAVITIKKAEDGQVVQVINAQTQNRRFEATFHLPPGEYTYEVCGETGG